MKSAIQSSLFVCKPEGILQGKRKLVREIGEFEKTGIKLQCLTEERERLLVRVIRRFEKMRVREIGIPLHINISKSLPFPFHCEAVVEWHWNSTIGY